MSVQLTLYPQWYNGVQTISIPVTQMVANPSNFGAVALGVGVIGTDPQTAQLAIDGLYSGMAANTWYGRYNTSGSGMQSNTSGGVLFYAGASCILQKLSGLVSGALYDVEIENHASVPSGNNQGMSLKIYNDNTWVSTALLTFSGGTGGSYAYAQFTAPSSNNTILLVDNNYSSTQAVTKVTVSAAPVQPPQPIQQLNNGSVICDLYEDEDLPLTLSIDNFKNAAEQVQSYSKAFNLPATKRNNKVFDQMYEITRSDDGLNFNPYKKTKAVLKENGILIFEGYLRMLDITDKEGEISYNVNLYSEVTALADTLGERTFSQLDFSELEHEYTISNITDSWDDVLPVAPLPAGSFAGAAGATTTDVLKYPFVDWNHQFYVDVNGNPELPNLECAFRPFIKLKYCIDMIFGAPSTPFSYTSSFFNSSEFGKLYMDFNWGADNAPVIFDSSGVLTKISNQSLTTSYTTLDFDEIVPSPLSVLDPNFGYSSGVFTAQEDGQVYDIDFNMEFDRNPLMGAEILDVEWVINGMANAAVYNQSVSIAGYTFSGNFTTLPLAAGDTILCQAKAYNVSTPSITTMTLEDALAGALPPTYNNVLTVNTSVSQTTNSSLLGTLRGELGQWDFLKGIMTMFNLVTMPDPDNRNNLLIEPYSDVFITNTVGTNLASRSIQHDWTEKIDISEMNLKPLTDLNLKTIFKFVEDDDDFCFSEYKRQVRHLYGSLTYTAFEFDILTGTEEIVAEPFAATVIKPLEAQYSDFIVPALYAKGDDGECSGFDNAPRIMYNNGKKTLTSCTYYVPEQNGGAELLTASNILQFSHLSSIPTVGGSTVDYHFGQCQLAGNITPVAANLFTRFWLPYYSQLYNPDTRTMTIKVNLNAGDINTFKFNDKVFIKNRIFRVNKIDYKPNDLAKVEFILIG